MKKKIKQWGHSLVIVLTKEDIDLYGLKVGDVLELDEMLWEKGKSASIIRMKSRK